MSDHVSSLGQTAEDIHEAASARCPQPSLGVRVTVQRFQRLIDEYGHVVKLELPGRICSFLRNTGGCLYAEVLRTPNLADAVIIAVFQSRFAFDTAAAALSTTVFTIEHLTLPTPPLAVESGRLEDVLAAR